MKFSNFKIRARIFMVLFMPILGLMLFAGQNMVMEYGHVQEGDKMAPVVNLVPAIGDLVHEMQKELGATSSFMNAKDDAKAAAKAKMETQRTPTSAAAEKLNALVGTFNVEGYGEKMVKQVSEIRRISSSLPGIREKINSETVPVVIKEYTDAISVLLLTVAQAATMTNDVSISAALNIANGLAMAKEYAGQERATGVGGFASGSFPPGQFKRIIGLASEQDGLLELSEDLSRVNPELETVFKIDAFESPKLDELRNVILTAGAGAPLPAERTADEWFKVTTDRINKMRETENALSKFTLDLLKENQKGDWLSFKAAVLQTLVFMILAGVFGMICVRSITVPVAETTESLRKLADHQLDFKITGADRRDELGAIARTMEIFRDNIMRADQLAAEQKREEDQKGIIQRRNAEYIREFETTIMGVLEGMKSADETMKKASLQMNESARETNMQTVNVATSAEEASVNVQTVASSAEELSSSIQEIARQMATSAQITTKAMRAADDATKEIQQLEEMVSKIGNVVQLITDIAEQTNLLALNATIEAARAGDAGKGFAVVASEVKGLASQTAKATEEISLQIKGVQQSTQTSADSLRGISNVIREINGVATTISSAVEEQNAATKDISRNVEQASVGTSQVSKSVVTVQKLTEDSKKTAENIKMSSERLTEETQALEGNVSAFLMKVRSNDSRSDDLIRWSDDISVGNEMIDADHKHLVEIVNKLYRLVREGKEGPAITSVYEEMKAHVTQHFLREEAAMEKANYPDFEKHRMQHQKFLDRLEADFSEYKNKKERSGESLLNLLGSWWVSHILTSDKKLSGYIKA